MNRFLDGDERVLRELELAGDPWPNQPYAAPAGEWLIELSRAQRGRRRAWWRPARRSDQYPRRQ